MCNNATNKVQLTVRIVYAIDGTVQGVGFRPTVFRLAKSANLGGWIQNRSGTVQLCLEGTPEDIGHFITFLHSHLPLQAAIEHIHQLSKEKIEITDISTFKIIESETTETIDVLIPADLAMCSECEKEIMDCENRRFGYPFTTCTNCGPRYTVVNDLPYDRERTTLNKFPLCEKCQREYEDPNDRRFHAESIACQNCGPQLSLVEEKSGSEPGLLTLYPKSKYGTDPNFSVLFQIRAKLANGEIAAIRGIGGYLMAVDAFNEKAIKRLRQRKNRPSKPFAVMFRDIETVFKYCKFNPEAVKLLISPEAPIVILDLKDEKSQKSKIKSQIIVEQSSPTANPSKHGKQSKNLQIPTNILSPDSKTIGAMIPYSPLHKLLFEQIADDKTPPFEALVMTSGNRGGEPICLTNEEAFERLEGIADVFLTHNREINLRNDDSLCTIQLGQPQIWRRARGYAPQKLRITNYELRNRNLGKEQLRALPSGATILAMGAELKNTIAMEYDDEIIMSPHIGDLETSEAVAGMEQVVKYFPKFLGKNPELIAVDLHPDMQSTRLGIKIAKNLFPEPSEAEKRTLSVQHHYAHAASCMGEHGLTKALALVFDGTGLGTDDTIWGAECFAVNFEKSATGSESRLCSELAKSKEALFNPPDRGQYRTLTSGTKLEVLAPPPPIKPKLVLAPTPIRLATFAPVPLPGGDAAVFHPLRQLLARYHNAKLSTEEICVKMRHYKSCSDKEIALWVTQCEKAINSPLTHAAGRLFDAVSSMLGIAPENVSYEGQSAIALEGAAKSAENTGSFNLDFCEKEENDMLIIDWKNLFSMGAGSGLLTSYPKSKYGTDPEVSEYALAFHHAVAKSAVRMIEYANKKYPMKDVVLSGGVFMNRILTELVSANLTKLGFNVYIHRKVPPNDGGISFGQAVIGRLFLKRMGLS